MQPPLQLRLPETKHSEGRIHKVIILFQDCSFPLIIGGRTTTCGTDAMTAVVPDLRRQHKKRYFSVHTNGLIIPRRVSIRPSLLSKQIEFNFFGKKLKRSYPFSHFGTSCELKTCFRTGTWRYTVELHFERSPRHSNSRTAPSRS